MRREGLNWDGQRLRKITTWNLNRLVQAHGRKEGERLFKLLPLQEALKLWHTEGPGKLEIN